MEVETVTLDLNIKTLEDLPSKLIQEAYEEIFILLILDRRSRGFGGSESGHKVRDHKQEQTHHRDRQHQRHHEKSEKKDRRVERHEHSKVIHKKRSDNSHKVADERRGGDRGARDKNTALQRDYPKKKEGKRTELRFKDNHHQKNKNRHRGSPSGKGGHFGKRDGRWRHKNGKTTSEKLDKELEKYWVKGGHADVGKYKLVRSNSNLKLYSGSKIGR